MNTQVVPFNESQLPAHLAAAGVSTLNTMAEAFASVAFPSISIKGKVFHIVREGKRTLITRPVAKAGDPVEPASAVEVVILNIQRAKTYYEDSYEEGSEAKPTCFSNDGIKPEASVEDKQCDTCELCPHNAWGSGTNDKGEATKGKACADVQRVAVASPANLDDAFLLRVPPASLKNLAETAKQLSGRNIPLNGVVMRITFDTNAASPTLIFRPVGYLDGAGFEKAKALENSQLVLMIIGKKGHTPAIVPPKEKPVASLAAPVAVATAAPAPVTPKKKTKKELAAEALAQAEAEEAAAATTTFGAPAATAAPVVTSSNFDQELAGLLG